MCNRIQPYEWGTRGEEAFIPRLLGIAPEGDSPYAELWMGTHPNAPSDVLVEGRPVPLSELIAQDPAQALGPRVAAAFAGTLPFLLKVLSAAQALSIQVHPNRRQAQALHARDPQHYVDANHKPEVAVALDSLTALVGFKSYEGIRRALEETPELAGFIGEGALAPATSGAEEQAAVRRLYQALIERSTGREAEMAEALERLTRRLQGRTAPRSEAEELFLALRRDYPGPDIGLFTLFLLNLVHLRAGQGVFIDAGVPHAYLRGNIVECMAASDNVVRAGLTPKFKDVQALGEILAYDLGTPPILEGDPGAAEVVYRTPAREFELARWQLDPGQGRQAATAGSLQILLVTEGQVRLRWAQGEEVCRQGRSLFVPAALGAYALRSEAPATVFCARVPVEGT